MLPSGGRSCVLLCVACISRLRGFLLCFLPTPGWYAGVLHVWLAVLHQPSACR